MHAQRAIPGAAAHGQRRFLELPEHHRAAVGHLALKRLAARCLLRETALECGLIPGGVFNRTRGFGQPVRERAATGVGSGEEPRERRVDLGLACRQSIDGHVARSLLRMGISAFTASYRTDGVVAATFALWQEANLQAGREDGTVDVEIL